MTDKELVKEVKSSLFRMVAEMDESVLAADYNLACHLKFAASELAEWARTNGVVPKKSKDAHNCIRMASFGGD